MLNRFIEGENERFVAFSNNLYKLSIDGILTDMSNVSIKEFDENGNIEIWYLDKLRVLNKSFLMAITFKPVYDSYNFIFDWKVLFIDDNSKNIHPSNLVWKPPSGGQLCPEDERFYVIPGFSRHGISKDGVFYNRATEKVLKSRLSGGYVNTSVYTDSGHLTVIGTHRALGLTFLDYPATVDDITVNHKDGVKNNNILTNLEWATYSENNIHAMDIGLRKSRKVGSVKDFINNTTITFKSLTKAANYLGIDSGSLLTRYLRYPNGLIKQRYCFRYSDDARPWPIFTPEQLDDVQKAASRRKENKECVAYNFLTGVTTIASYPCQLASIIGIHKDYLRTALDSIKPWPVKNYICYYLKSPKNIPTFSDEEKEAFKDRSGIISPISLIKKDGTMKVFVSSRELSLYLGKDIRFVESRLGRVDIYECDEYTIKRLIPKYS